MAAAATVKVKLLRSVLLAPASKRGSGREAHQGETIEVSPSVAERFVRIGAAEKTR